MSRETRREKLAADTASGARRLKNILFVRFMKNKQAFRVRFRVNRSSPPDEPPQTSLRVSPHNSDDELELEGIPQTIDERTFRLIVPRLHTFTLSWDQLISFTEAKGELHSRAADDDKSPSPHA